MFFSSRKLSLFDVGDCVNNLQHMLCLFLSALLKTRCQWCSWRSRQFFCAQIIFCPNFPNFAWNTLCDKLFPYKFSVAVDSLCFPLPSCHRLENRKFGEIWFNPIEKSTLGCARSLSEASCLITTEHLPHSSEVWHSIHIPAVAVSKERHT